MLSRVAENLYWMSRQIERADSLARLVMAHQNELLDATAMGSWENEWHPLLEVTSMGDEESTEGVVTYMVSSRENPDSIFQCIFYARENARGVRDQITEEMWVELNSLWLSLSRYDVSDPDRHMKMCNEVIQFSFLFRGIVSGVLPRTDAWHFVRLGETIERADKTSRMLDLPNFLPKPEITSAWNTMLKATSATVEHQQQYGGEVDRSSAISLLLFSTTFPRAVRYCAIELDRILHLISGTREEDYLNEAERAAGAFRSRMNFQGVEDLGRLGLHKFIDAIQKDLNKIGDEIVTRYFMIRPKEFPSSAQAYVASRVQAHAKAAQQ
ncbi:MAG: alpha-E domain-containing protein [Verrucomicrobiales bacterium]|nr:alpha-E domain-containing protein [Verrucomicrobiales bacterium]